MGQFEAVGGVGGQGRCDYYVMVIGILRLLCRI